VAASWAQVSCAGLLLVADVDLRGERQWSDGGRRSWGPVPRDRGAVGSVPAPVVV